jgi:hypothetical protein
VRFDCRQRLPEKSHKESNRRHHWKLVLYIYGSPFDENNELTRKNSRFRELSNITVINAPRLHSLDDRSGFFAYPIKMDAEDVFRLQDVGVTWRGLDAREISQLFLEGFIGR